MPISFLNPALLVGLAAAAVPVIIHFLSRRRVRRVAFSDLRFLAEEETHQARRRGVRRWLLLLLRVLIILCLALAAARPHWGGLPGSGGRSVVFVLDASASMQTQQDDGRHRFEAARALVGDMIVALPAEASVQVVQAGPTASALFATWLPAGEPARAALGAALPTDGGLDLAAALREVTRLEAEAPSRPVDVVLVSDLQRTAQPGLAEAAAALAGREARVLVRRVGEAATGGAVLDVTLPGRALQPGEAVVATAIVVPERADQAFWLELDGRRVAESVAPPGAPPGEPVALPLSFTVPPAGLHAGVVGKGADRLPVDDTRPFALEVPGRIDVLLAHGADRDGLGRGGWRYLAGALAPDAAAGGLFAVRSVPVDSLLALGLGGVELLVMVDAGSPGRRLSGLLKPWVERGGALLVLAGDPGQEQDLRTGWLPLLDLPAEASWVARDADQAERARVVDPGHPVLADLGEAPLAALGAARWWRYFAVGEGEARVLLAADSGAPLLLEGELGRGRWLLAPFHLRRDATDLMLNPVFLPLVQRAAARLVAGGGRAANLTVGDQPALPVSAERLGLREGDSAADLQVLVPPAGAPRPAELRWLATGPTVSAPPAMRAGLYAFVAQGDTIGLAAATVPAAESQARPGTVGELGDALEAAGVPRVIDLGAATAAGLVSRLAGHDLARWLLLAALVLMAAELWVGRRVG
jgi:hypothetical protein